MSESAAQTAAALGAARASVARRCRPHLDAGRSARAPSPPITPPFSTASHHNKAFHFTRTRVFREGRKTRQFGEGGGWKLTPSQVLLWVARSTVFLNKGGGVLCPSS